MRYKKRTHYVEAFRVKGCEITIHRRDGDIRAKEGDMIVVQPNGEYEAMPLVDFMRFYEDDDGGS